MFTQKNPARCMSGQARDVFAGQNSTSGGDNETELNDWQVMPTGSPLLIEVTTVTPVANSPSTSRKFRACASASGSSVGRGVSSPSRKWKSKSRHELVDQLAAKASSPARPGASPQGAPGSQGRSDPARRACQPPPKL